MCKLCCVVPQGGDGGAAYVKLREEHMDACAFILRVAFVFAS